MKRNYKVPSLCRIASIFPCDIEQVIAPRNTRHFRYSRAHDAELERAFLACSRRLNECHHLVTAASDLTITFSSTRRGTCCGKRESASYILAHGCFPPLQFYATNAPVKPNRDAPFGRFAARTISHGCIRC